MSGSLGAVAAVGQAKDGVASGRSLAGRWDAPCFQRRPHAKIKKASRTAAMGAPLCAADRKDGMGLGGIRSADLVTSALQKPKNEERRTALMGSSSCSARRGLSTPCIV